MGETLNRVELEADAKLERREAAGAESKSTIEDRVIRTKAATEAHAAILGIDRENIEEIIESDKGIEYKTKDKITGIIPAAEVKFKERAIAKNLGLEEGASRTAIGRAIVEGNLKKIGEQKRADIKRLGLPEGASEMLLARARGIDKEERAQTGTVLSEEQIQENVRMTVRGMLAKPKKEIAINDLPPEEPSQPKPKPSFFKKLFGGGQQ